MSYSSIIVAVQRARAGPGAPFCKRGTPWANTRIPASPEPPFGAHHVPGSSPCWLVRNEVASWPSIRRGCNVIIEA